MQTGVGKSVYTLEGHEAELDKYTAQKVTVKGSVKGESLTVESCKAIGGGRTASELLELARKMGSGHCSRTRAPLLPMSAPGH